MTPPSRFGVGEVVRVNVPGVGDHGELGHVTAVVSRAGRHHYYVRMCGSQIFHLFADYHLRAVGAVDQLARLSDDQRVEQKHGTI
jgi:hypothetical protein